MLTKLKRYLELPLEIKALNMPYENTHWQNHIVFVHEVAGSYTQAKFNPRATDFLLKELEDTGIMINVILHDNKTTNMQMICNQRTQLENSTTCRNSYMEVSLDATNESLVHLIMKGLQLSEHSERPWLV